MSDKRIIKVNPELFKIPDTTKKKRVPKQPKEMKIKSSKRNTNNNNNTVKKKLLSLLRRKQDEKVKPQSNNEKQTIKSKNQEILDSFEDEFKNSLEYLNNLSKNQQITHRPHNSTIKQPMNSYENVHLTLPDELREA